MRFKGVLTILLVISIITAVTAPVVQAGILDLFGACGGTDDNGQPSCGNGVCPDPQKCTLISGGFFKRKKNPPYCACRFVFTRPVKPIAIAD